MMDDLGSGELCGAQHRSACYLSFGIFLSLRFPSSLHFPPPPPLYHTEPSQTSQTPEYRSSALLCALMRDGEVEREPLF